jgi:hypothetical protein
MDVRSKEVYNKVAEIKIRYIDDTRQWEQVSVYDRIASHTLYEVISRLLKSPDVDEVRWNYLGSLQGHYHRRTD